MIYLDNAATTKPSEAALEKASRFNAECFFNPSALYRGGLENNRELKISKETILNSLSAFGEYECIFTSCGTESDNQAVFSSAKRGVAVTTEGEHAAVYKSFLELKNRGVEIRFAPLKKNGAADVPALLELIKNGNVRFVSVMHVNNETGAINDINAIAKAVKVIDKSIIFHSDGVQAYGKIPYHISRDVDLYSVSAHKINALKGVGALIRKKSVPLSPFLYGGGQEGGLRSGTENIFGIKVFEYAAEEKSAHLKEYLETTKKLNALMRSRLDPRFFEIISDEDCSPYILSVIAKGVKGEVVMHMLEEYGIYVGNGSACSSKNRYSRVIDACGYKNNDGVIRISFSPYLKEEEILIAAEKLNECTKKLLKVMKK